MTFKQWLVDRFIPWAATGTGLWVMFFANKTDVQWFVVVGGWIVMLLILAFGPNPDFD